MSFRRGIGIQKIRKYGGNTRELNAEARLSYWGIKFWTTSLISNLDGKCFILDPGKMDIFFLPSFVIDIKLVWAKHDERGNAVGNFGYSLKEPYPVRPRQY